MHIFENIYLAIRSLLNNKVRSFLAMLGVIIGVVSVISLVAFGESTKDFVYQRLTTMGRGTKTIGLQPFADKGISAWVSLIQSSYDSYFNSKTVRVLEKNCPTLKYIDYRLTRTGYVAHGKKKIKVFMIQGVSENFKHVDDQPIKYGRHLSAIDIRQHRRVIIVAPTVAKELFGKTNIIGKKVKIMGIVFTVVGELSPGGSLLDVDVDNMVYIPVTVAQEIFKTKRYSEIVIKVGHERDVPKAKSEVIDIMEKEYPNKTFRIVTQDENLSILYKIMNVISIMIVGFASISLTVATINIMNIMLVSVAGRIHEIGIRKSIGARRIDIFQQFLIESFTLSAVGGAMGIIIANLMSFSILNYFSLSFNINIFINILVFVVACLVGVVSGVYPAMRAAEIDPIVAMRYD